MSRDEARAPHPLADIPFDRVHDFLVAAALPLWSTRGFYDNGCFVEHLDLAGNPVDPGFTRVRVQARQIYVFSHAQWAGLFEAKQVGARALDFFLRSCWLGPERGFARRVGRDGALIDATSDLYDISFALFALAWRYRVAPDSALLEIAHATLDFLEAHLKHPLGGYHNDAARNLPRQQNPHMHLAEAAIAWHEASGEARFCDLAEDLIDLAEHRLCDSASGALGEFFESDWTPAAAPAGNIVEPGHQFEWAWIVAHHGRLSGRRRDGLVRRLIASALRHGFDESSGLTVDQVGRDGRIIDASMRLWPQTEALKASLAAAEFFGEIAPTRIAKIVEVIFSRFLDSAPLPGTWIDHFNADGSLRADKIPATSLYHLTLAFLELLRLRRILTSSAASDALS